MKLYHLIQGNIIDHRLIVPRIQSNCHSSFKKIKKIDTITFTLYCNCDYVDNIHFLSVGVVVRLQIKGIWTDLGDLFHPLFQLCSLTLEITTCKILVTLEQKPQNTAM